ncbi:stealth family protein [Serinicoccus kebangsaanensis]|uniref:stealth family protein n=1 Tax=Serinicoccus kebangsaanensis TaxID=2602069 RepID=UPI001EE1C89E|nr:stealth family protein [Serinicoccus kebangsaanensis]
MRALARHLVPPQVRARREAARRELAEQAERDRLARKEQAELQRRRARVEERRQALLAADPQVRLVSQGRLDGPGRVVETFTAAGAADRNLRLVTDVLCAAGIDYFMVRGRSRTRHVVGVRLADRAALLREMRERYRSSALWAIRPGAGGKAQVLSAYVDGALDPQIKKGLVIRFAEPLLSPAGRVLAGAQYGCDVEFWRDGGAVLERDSAEQIKELRCQTPPEALARSRVAPRANRVADVLPPSAQRPATIEVGGKQHPTVEPFTWTLMDEVTFPVDVVYTWVDGGDAAHAALRARFRGDQDVGIAANASRFASHDELRYSLRSLHMYAPFVRHVYLVTDDQCPEWLDRDAPGITVVDHRDIFTDRSALPTFNSHAIESQLHHIDGLSDRYLYLNDDVFLARPMRAEDFFHANGIAQVPFSPSQFGVGELIDGEVAPNSAGKNARSLLAADFGRGITHKFKHAPHPQIRQVLLDLEAAYPDALGATMRSRFRSPHDVALAATLHHHYALLTGRAVPGEVAMRYVDIGADDARERLARLEASPQVDTFCLNDVDTPPEAREAAQQMMREFLVARFPFPSPFERRGGAN